MLKLSSRYGLPSRSSSVPWRARKPDCSTSGSTAPQVLPPAHPTRTTSLPLPFSAARTDEARAFVSVVVRMAPPVVEDTIDGSVTTVTTAFAQVPRTSATVMRVDGRRRRRPSSTVTAAAGVARIVAIPWAPDTPTLARHAAGAEAPLVGLAAAPGPAGTAPVGAAANTDGPTAARSSEAAATTAHAIRAGAPNALSLMVPPLPQRSARP